MAVLDYVKYANGDDADKRVLAVNAGLELIQSRVSTLPTGTNLEVELGKLSKYADLIQAALSKAE